MAIRYGRGDVKQTTTGFRGPLMVQSLTSAKSKFLSLEDLSDSMLSGLFRGYRRGLGKVDITYPPVHSFLQLTDCSLNTLCRFSSYIHGKF